jgi:hypothetical protein
MLGIDQNIGFLWVPSKGKLSEWSLVMFLYSWSVFYFRVSTKYWFSVGPKLRIDLNPTEIDTCHTCRLQKYIVGRLA